MWFSWGGYELLFSITIRKSVDLLVASPQTTGNYSPAYTDPCLQSVGHLFRPYKPRVCYTGGAYERSQTETLDTIRIMTSLVYQTLEDEHSPRISRLTLAIQLKQLHKCYFPKRRTNPEATLAKYSAKVSELAS